MSTIKSDAVTASTGTNQNLDLSGKGTGGVKITDYLIQTKGSDIASDTALTLGKDANLFDVTGTTTITSIATQGIGSVVILHFDGALTFTHHSTNLILPGAANITTAAGDIAVMYEYASADWRCVSYTKASGAAVVAGGSAGMEFVEAVSASTSTTITLGDQNISVGYDYIITWHNVHMTADASMILKVGTGSGPTILSSGYVGNYTKSNNVDTPTGVVLATASIDLQSTGGGNTAGELGMGEATFLNPASTVASMFHYTSHFRDTGTTNVLHTGAGKNTGTAAITAFQFQVTASNIASGSFVLLRRKITA